MKNLNKILPWFSLGAVIGLIYLIPFINTALTCPNSTYGCFYTYGFDGSIFHLVIASAERVIAFGLLGMVIGGLVLTLKRWS